MSAAIVYDATPDSQRNRLTVFFRLLLVIPHLITLTVYGIGVFFAVIAAWFALLATGTYPPALFNFVSGVVQYYTRFSAYVYLLVDPYPPFDLGAHPEYPVRLHIQPLESYNRLTVLFRIVLMIPVYIINYVLGIVLEVFAILIWIVAVIVGRMPDGLAGVQLFCLSYAARANAYFALLTEEWPPISQAGSAIPPRAAAPAADFAPPHAGAAPPPPPPPPGPNPFGG